LFFICLLLWVITTDKKLIFKFKTLPLEDNLINNTTLAKEQRL
jgi:hypothetical protein